MIFNESSMVIHYKAFVDGLKAKKLPPEMRIAKAKIIGCQHCSFVVSHSNSTGIKETYKAFQLNYNFSVKRFRK